MTEQALASAQQTGSGVSGALGIKSGMFTAQNLLAAAIALVVCIIAIWIVMSV